jgi:hypothetical protein
LVKGSDEMEQQPINSQHQPAYNPYGQRNFKPETDTELVASLATPGQQSSIKKTESMHPDKGRVIAESPTRSSEIFTTDSRLGNLNKIEEYLVKQYLGLSLILSYISENSELDLLEAQKYFSVYAGIHENISTSRDGFLVKAIRSSININESRDNRLNLPEQVQPEKRGLFSNPFKRR